MYYYAVCGIRVDNGAEETVKTFDCGMDLTDQEARIAALEYELFVNRDSKYSSSSVSRRIVVLK
jgi:hypothetical protein